MKALPTKYEEYKMSYGLWGLAYIMAHKLKPKVGMCSVVPGTDVTKT